MLCAGFGIVERDGRTRPIDEQLLARTMLLAQHQIALAFPALVVMAEAAVPVAVGVRGPVLLPQQLPGGVLVPLQLFVQVGKVGQRALGSRLAAFAGYRRKQRRFQLCL